MKEITVSDIMAAAENHTPRTLPIAFKEKYPREVREAIWKLSTEKKFGIRRICKILKDVDVKIGIDYIRTHWSELEEEFSGKVPD